MMHSVVILSIFVTVLALAGVTQAGTISVSLGSDKPILYSMDLTVNRGSFTYLYAQGQSRIDSIYKERTRPDTLRLKNPNIALLIAILPGSVVHGAGHFYAGRLKTGFFLLGIEVVSAGLVFAGAISGLAQMDEAIKKGDPEMLVFVGAALFIGSWLYDIIGAPLTIARENEKILEKQAMAKQRI